MPRVCVQRSLTPDSVDLQITDSFSRCVALDFDDVFVCISTVVGSDLRKSSSLSRGNVDDPTSRIPFVDMTTNVLEPRIRQATRLFIDSNIAPRRVKLSVA